jgi:CelD/BcsL family acetyltransferase involved in cellulose biosynthesis
MDGVLCDRNVQNFNREAACEFLSLGVLRLYGLRIDDRIIASLYAFHQSGCTYYYLGGFQAVRSGNAAALARNHGSDQ